MALKHDFRCDLSCKYCQLDDVTLIKLDESCHAEMNGLLTGKSYYTYQCSISCNDSALAVVYDSESGYARSLQGRS